eukprot:jgi/Galph1/887/GphlegSOOS_G5630.1
MQAEVSLPSPRRTIVTFCGYHSLKRTPNWFELWNVQKSACGCYHSRHCQTFEPSRKSVQWKRSFGWISSPKTMYWLRKGNSSNCNIGFHLRLSCVFIDDIAEVDEQRLQNSNLPSGGKLVPEDEPETGKKRRRHSPEVRRKISMAMTGKRKSRAARAAMSLAKKGKISPNRGHKLTVEARARLSLSLLGRRAWNKGKNLSMKHRLAISLALSDRRLSEEHRQKMRLARLRFMNKTVSCSSASSSVAKSSNIGNVNSQKTTVSTGMDKSTWPLLTTQEIHEYVLLRRELRVWNEKFSLDSGSSPSLSLIRKEAPKAIIKKYEKYLEYRERFRGLASDVYGSVAPDSFPIPAKSGRFSRSTVDSFADDSSSLIESSPPELLDASLCKCRELEETAHSNPLNDTATIPLTPSAYRILGRYRLLETHDIHEFVALRKELRSWSDKYLKNAEKNLSRDSFKKFQRYIKIRENIQGLVRETFGIDKFDMNSIEAVTEMSVQILKSLKIQTSETELTSILQEKDS